MRGEQKQYCSFLLMLFRSNVLISSLSHKHNEITIQRLFIPFQRRQDPRDVRTYVPTKGWPISSRLLVTRFYKKEKLAFTPYQPLFGKGTFFQKESICTNKCRIYTWKRHKACADYFYVILTQSHLARKNPNWENVSTNWPVGKPVVHLLDWWLMQEVPGHCE